MPFSRAAPDARQIDGIREINRLSGTKIEADIWDAIEKRFAATR